MCERVLNPNATAVRASCLPPVATATGPNTELQLWANACTSVPPHSSWWKLISLKPPTSAKRAGV